MKSHPILDQELMTKTCLYCNTKLSRMNDVLFCPHCNQVFIKDKEHGTHFVNNIYHPPDTFDPYHFKEG